MIRFTLKFKNCKIKNNGKKFYNDLKDPFNFHPFLTNT